MLTVRVRLYPALGREAEVRSFMTEWVKAAQAQGENLSLAQRIFTSEGPMLMVPRRYEDMTALDARRRANLADSSWQDRLATLGTMLREPVRQSIEESVVPIGASTGPVSVVRRVFFYPSMDKALELRTLLANFVEGAHSAGRGQVGLSQQIYSDAGPTLVLTTTHADLPALDRVRQERAAEAAALVASVAGLSRAPIAVRLLEVVVPFPR